MSCGPKVDYIIIQLLRLPRCDYSNTIRFTPHPTNIFIVSVHKALIIQLNTGIAADIKALPFEGFNIQQPDAVGLGALSNTNLAPGADTLPLLPLAITRSQVIFSKTYQMILSEGSDIWSISTPVEGLVAAGKVDSTDDCPTDFAVSRRAWKLLWEQ